jgi:hypothetical protein
MALNEDEIIDKAQDAADEMVDKSNLNALRERKWGHTST